MILTFAGFALQTNVVGLHDPPFAPHCASAVQLVVHLPAAHEPATSPGQSASSAQLAAAGSANGPTGPFGEAQIDVT